MYSYLSYSLSNNEKVPLAFSLSPKKLRSQKTHKRAGKMAERPQLAKEREGAYHIR